MVIKLNKNIFSYMLLSFLFLLPVAFTAEEVSFSEIYLKQNANIQESAKKLSKDFNGELLPNLKNLTTPEGENQEEFDEKKQALRNYVAKGIVIIKENTVSFYENLDQSIDSIEELKTKFPTIDVQKFIDSFKQIKEEKIPALRQLINPDFFKKCSNPLESVNLLAEVLQKALSKGDDIENNKFKNPKLREIIKFVKESLENNPTKDFYINSENLLAKIDGKDVKTIEISPEYLLREMAQMIVKLDQLLPSDEFIALLDAFRKTIKNVARDPLNYKDKDVSAFSQDLVYPDIAARIMKAAIEGFNSATVQKIEGEEKKEIRIIDQKPELAKLVSDIEKDIETKEILKNDKLSWLDYFYTLSLKPTYKEGQSYVSWIFGNIGSIFVGFTIIGPIEFYSWIKGFFGSK